MASTKPVHAQPLRLAPLAACLAAGVLASASVCATHAPSALADPPWTGFRADPGKRLFPQMPATRGEAPAAPVPTAVWPVTSCADEGPGSLRAAVASAADGDTIDLTALTCGTITLETGAIAVEVGNLTLEGPGRTALVIDGNALDRVFFHPYGGALTLRDMTLQGGRITAEAFDVTGGGCIASAGYLTLEDTTVRDCYAVAIGAYGGAVYAYSLTMTNSTLSGNHARGKHFDAGTAAFGGAAFVYTMAIQHSTISGNIADHRIADTRTSYDIAGGIVTIQGGTVSDSTIDSNFADGRGGGIATFSAIGISNSTFSGNVATVNVGGGLFVRRPATAQISNSTFTDNQSAIGGGGIWIAATDALLQSTIVYGNTTGAAYSADIEALLPLTLSGNNNQVGVASANIALPADTLDTDPLLRPLASNGGPTRTHALGVGSPAVDTGNNSMDLAFDQRGAGFPRIFGSAADIGAYEQQGIPVAQTPVPALSAWFAALLAVLLAMVARPWVRTAPHRGRT